MASMDPATKKVKLDDGSPHTSGSSVARWPWDKHESGTLRCAIKKNVSDWVAALGSSAEEVDEDEDVGAVFGLQTYDVSEEEFDEIFEERRYADSVDGYNLAEYERFVEALNSRFVMNLDLPEFYGSRDRNPFRGWPSSVRTKKPKKFQDVCEKLSSSYSCIKDKEIIITSTNAAQKSKGAPALMPFKALLSEAARFHVELGTFIKQHQHSTDIAAEDLFTAFCRMADVKVHKGGALPTNWNVLGIGVTSVPGLRIRNLVHECEELTGQKPDLNGPDLPVKTTAVVEVKRLQPIDCTSDSDTQLSGRSLLDTNGKVLGQMFGELLLELPYTTHKEGTEIFGILVRSTKVTFLHMHMAKKMLDAISKAPGRSPCNIRDECPVIKFSPGYDMLKCADRSKILKYLYRLNWMVG